MANRAEIDTRAPFRSVKEAVILFGDKVLAGELYANQLKQNGANHENGVQAPFRFRIAAPVAVTAELEETKQSLQKAKEESEIMATSLSSLQQELERTKRELQQLKEQESEKQVVQESKIPTMLSDNNYSDVDDDRQEFQKKRCVTFANPPSRSHGHGHDHDHVLLEREPSLNKKKNKQKKALMIPSLIGGIFSRKKFGRQHISV